MPTFTSDAYLRFTANDIGTTLTPTGNFTHNSTNFNVFDDGDGNADTATDYFIATNVSYSGYTMELDGADYAIFTDGNFYYIPYFDPTEGFASLNNTAITQPITQSGENAVVVNLCFGAGTLIATPTGERVVESLRIGDLITTADGRHVPVKWLGQQTHQTPAVNMRLPDRAQPVRIRAGALGGGLPHTDLLVTGDHAMLLDGMLINAAALVNGASIDWVPMAELGNSFTVYHVEVEAHEVILANGAQTESFVDVAGRKTFDNYDAYMARYGSERIIPEMRLPRITAQRMVPAYIGDRQAS